MPEFDIEVIEAWQLFVSLYIFKIKEEQPCPFVSMIYVTITTKTADVIKKEKKKCFNTVCLMEVKAEPLLKQYKLMQNSNYII